MNFSENINTYLKDLKKVIDLLDIEEINLVLNKLLETHERGGTIYIFGNGGSAATASHFVNDFNKGVSENLRKRFKFISLNDNTSTVLAIANDLGYSEIFKFQLENFLNEGDLVIGISGSGNSDNVIKAVEYANSKGVCTVGFSGYDGGKLKSCATYGIHVPVNHMQKVEDIHMVLDHLMMTVLKQYLEGEHR